MKNSQIMSEERYQDLYNCVIADEDMPFELKDEYDYDSMSNAWRIFYG